MLLLVVTIVVETVLLSNIFQYIFIYYESQERHFRSILHFTVLILQIKLTIAKLIKIILYKFFCEGILLFL